ncbi:winged helix DNA-binding domain-containing protein, partial [Fomitiporia mediterranea MF3/22]|uniref:winged helix DNA-binding domain-containing protein n=1 Tax=Fomitiporia mediterranea (strain MF3/22) TaxID=694068 RepID=UPI000440884F
MGTQLQPAQWSSVTSGKPASAPALVPASFHDSDDEDPTQDHIPIDIYQHFGLPPGTPICLDSLEDPPPGVKPAYTYATLVKLAIWSSPQRKLTLSGIYEALERRFSWFRECENPSAWKTSIRHSLSLMAVFVKLPMDIHVPGKGCNWTVD